MTVREELDYCLEQIAKDQATLKELKNNKRLLISKIDKLELEKVFVCSPSSPP